MAWDPLGAVLDFAGGILSNKANAKQGRLNREFQERMSSTSHQRAVADLKAAGLNPMLSVMHQGASSPAGAQAHMENPFKDAGQKISSAAVAKLTRELLGRQVEKTIKETDAIETNQVEALSRTRVNDAQEQEILSRIPMHVASAEVSRQQKENMIAEVGRIAAEISRMAEQNKLTAAEVRTSDTLRPLLAEMHALQNRLHQAQVPGAQVQERLNSNAYYGPARAVLKDVEGVLGSVGGGAILGTVLRGPRPDEYEQTSTETVNRNKGREVRQKSSTTRRKK